MWGHLKHIYLKIFTLFELFTEVKIFFSVNLTGKYII